MRARLALAVSVAASIAACARVPPPDLSLDPETLAEQVRRAAAGVASVRGEARVRAKGQRGAAIQALVAAEKPDRLRLEALDFFGNPVAVLATGGGRLAIYDARDRTYYRGSATPANVGRLVPVAIAPDELAAILCGAPLLEGDPVRAEPGRGHVTLELRDGPRTTTLRVGAGAAVKRASVRRPGPDGGYDVEYGEAGSADGTFLPGDVTLSAKSPPVSVELGWMEFEANAALEPALFRLEPPAGARVVDLDAGGLAPPPVFPADPAPGG